MAPADAAAPWWLERRLRRQLLLSLLLLWLLGGVGSMWALHGEIREVLDSALEETAQRLLMLPDAALAATDDSAFVAAFGDHEEHVVYQVFDGDGVLRLRSHRAPLTPLASPRAAGLAEQGGFRVISMRRADGGRVVHVAETLAHRREVVWDSLPWLLLPLLAVLPLAAWVLHSVLRAGFSTLQPALEVLDGSAAPRLRPLPLEGTPGELRPLLSGMNMLIERVRMLVDAERSFAARTAHELRTPLAAARAQAQRLQQQGLAAGAPELAEPTQALVRQLDRITALASRLLQLARIESGVAWQREPVELGLLGRMVVDEFTESRTEGRLSLRVAADAGIVSGDADALGIALRNLIDNALRHGGDTGRVRVEALADGLRVVDDGPGVPPDELARLVRPFERGATAAEGSGLGLAMADRVARQSGAELRLRSPVEAGRGFEAVLHFAPGLPG